MKKKIWFFCLLFALGCWALWFGVFALSPQTEFFISAFEKELKTKSQTEQTRYLHWLRAVLSDPQIRSKTQVKILVSELYTWVETKLSDKVLETQVNTSISAGSELIQLQGVDATRVRNAWLERHNQARADKGLPPLNYHSELERSATARSQYQVDNGYVAHKRNSNDGYYNYVAIQDWFAAMGIRFSQLWAGRSSFSESMGYRGYSCNQADCTQALLNATKKSFDAFMKEGINGAHYKAIMMPHYTQMGVGFAVDSQKKIVYTTIHYSTELVD